ncbi:VPLPA-CTERM sorting domain-containing protein [Roseobacter sp. SK209-2-6]|uniref:VPLPA-CTERM sorting domain-containing protein n=1 Tax=Roseobacter sp. SK209-2-6 TaxID=388739 RepID=UPI000A01B005|nr:VPLPA-CTERM sorting domain-containing protein [Roseobacter sp. SK209-2-6]
MFNLVHKLSEATRRLSVGFATLAILAFSTSTASSTTLSTGLTPNNNHNGVMFDIQVGSSDLSLTDIAANFMSSSADYELYYIAGGIGSNLNNPGSWTLHDSISSLAGGSGLSVWNIADLLLSANTMYGLYLTSTGGSDYIGYRNGSSVGDVIASDSNLSILSGYGRSHPFGGTFSPRSFAGSLSYDIAAVPLPAAGFLLLGALGGAAALRRRKKIN